MKNLMLACISILAILSAGVNAAQLNSTSYKQNVIVSVGGESANSTSYKTTLAIGIITKIINSTSYINRLGFFHTWLLANDQPCTSDNQCEGGFCCSNKCKSSACPSEEPAPSGGGGGAAAGGGGGGGRAPLPLKEEEEEKDFSVSPSAIKEELILNAAKAKFITIRNTGNTPLAFSLDVTTISDMVLMSDTSFSLGPGEEKVVEANLIGKKLGSYLGEIEISADGIIKTISIVIEVESEQVLFDAKMDIPTAYKKVKPGDELKMQITLLNIGPPRKVDVTTTYIIKDKRGSVIYESSETFAVDKQISFVKSFKLPEYLEPGDYLAIVEVRYANSFAVSSELFTVVKDKPIIEKIKTGLPFTLTFLIVIIAISILAYAILPRFRAFRKRGKR